MQAITRELLDTLANKSRNNKVSYRPRGWRVVTKVYCSGSAFLFLTSLGLRSHLLCRKKNVMTFLYVQTGLTRWNFNKRCSGTCTCIYFICGMWFSRQSTIDTNIEVNRKYACSFQFHNFCNSWKNDSFEMTCSFVTKTIAPYAIGKCASIADTRYAILSVSLSKVATKRTWCFLPQRDPVCDSSLWFLCTCICIPSVGLFYDK